MRHLAGHRSVAFAELVHERRPARVGQQLAAVADEAAGGDDELHPDTTVGIGGHLLEATLPAGHRLLDGADVLGRDVDRHPLVRLLAVAQDHLGTADRELEALASHLLDEDRQLELAATAHLERLARVTRVDLDRHVAEDLAVESRLDLARL